jgi:hypothetical protein
MWSWGREGWFVNWPRGDSISGLPRLAVRDVLLSDWFCGLAVWILTIDRDRQPEIEESRVVHIETHRQGLRCGFCGPYCSNQTVWNSSRIQNRVSSCGPSVTGDEKRNGLREHTRDIIVGSENLPHALTDWIPRISLHVDDTSFAASVLFTWSLLLDVCLQYILQSTGQPPEAVELDIRTVPFKCRSWMCDTNIKQRTCDGMIKGRSPRRICVYLILFGIQSIRVK